MSKLDELMALAEEYAEKLSGWDVGQCKDADVSEAKSALQDALKAVVEDAEAMREALETIAAQHSGKVASTAWADCMASIARFVTDKSVLGEVVSQPTTEQGWLHRIEMEKTAAWQRGYAQGLHRAAIDAARKP